MNTGLYSRNIPKQNIMTTEQSKVNPSSKPKLNLELLGLAPLFALGLLIVFGYFTGFKNNFLVDVDL
jgi:hypothetical protein